MLFLLIPYTYFNNTTNYTPTLFIDNSNNNLILSLQSGIGIGYNAKNFFIGVSVNKTIKDQNFNTIDHSEKIQVHTSKNVFFAFLGYRFKAPKSIAKPIDDLEERIPILHK